MVSGLVLADVVKQLLKAYGRPSKHSIRDPFEMILWELSAELASDEKRAAAFTALKKRIGATPKAIAEAAPMDLVEVAKLGGMEPERRARRMQDAAVIALEEFGGDLRPILKLPLKDAKRALRKFPSVGEPGAEKILMLMHSHPVLSLESNGLRVLSRLGFGEQKKDYASTYRSVQEAIAAQLPADFDTLIAAHKLLRRHGQEICKTSRPSCDACMFQIQCPAATIR